MRVDSKTPETNTQWPLQSWKLDTRGLVPSTEPAPPAASLGLRGVPAQPLGTVIALEVMCKRGAPDFRSRTYIRTYVCNSAPARALLYQYDVEHTHDRSKNKPKSDRPRHTCISRPYQKSVRDIPDVIIARAPRPG
jgi:hypothetical protein